MIAKDDDLLHDTREIESVWSVQNDEGSCFKVGNNGVTKIEIYAENGQMAYVNWCAVFQDDVIKWRFDMAGMGVTYKK
ncbi:MAG: hypothetical protein WC428_06770 [Candidatus Paceibacterota bacterium]